ncbi:MAG: histidine kinase N-terminal 7TM domain-containing protein [Actinomycetota bacterium]
MVVLIIGAVLCAVYLVIAGYVFRHRQVVGGNALIVLLLAAGWWTICGGVEVVTPDPVDQESWGLAKYFGVVLVPPSLVVFALEYTGRRRRVGWRSIILLSVEPLLLLGALWVPTTRRLVRYLPDDAQYGEYAVAEVGPLFWAHAGYSYVLIVVGVALLVVGVLRAAPLSLRGWLLIIACMTPVIVNAIYNLDVTRVEVDPTPAAFSAASLVLVWGFFRFRLHELVPVGRRQVVDRIPDSVIVLDRQGRVVDANPAATALAGLSSAALIGRDVLDIFPQLHSVVDAPQRGREGAAQSGTFRMRTRAATITDVDFAVTVSPLPDARAPAGRLVVLRDITEQRNVERQLRELVRERNTIIETLRRGLQPVRMPAIPGLEVATVLDPAESDSSIGGDFVDVRPAGHSRWTFMVGDVVGKGPQAATLTAMARHTAVALSAIGWSPARVLSEVNRAIAVEEQIAGTEWEARFCTMALATVELNEKGAMVSLALGGHPRPFLVDGRGRVTEVGVPGSLLGVMPDPDLHDVTIQLRPGAALVMFTDGITDARLDGEPYGERRFAEILGTLGGLPADILIDELVADVRQFTARRQQHDDLAVLVIRVPPPKR